MIDRNARSTRFLKGPLMRPFFRTFTAAAATTCLTALPALAQMSAAELWANWQSETSDQGYAISAQTQTPRDDGLDLTGLMFSYSVGDDTLTSTLDSLQLTDTADGVDVVVPGGQKLVVEIASVADGDSKAVFDLTAGDLLLRATGAIASPDYAISANTFSVNLDLLEEVGTQIPAEFVLGFSNLDGTLTGLTPDHDSTIFADLTAAALTLALDVTHPISGDRATTATAASDVAIQARITPGVTEQEGTVSATLTGGEAQTSSRQSGPSTGIMETLTRQSSSRLTLEIADGRADYGVEVTGLEASMTSDRLPIPQVSVELASAKIDLSMPAATADDPQTARVTARLTDLIFDDALWAMVDPGRTLPRDPAQFSLDLEGDLLVSDPPAAPTEATPATPALPGVRPQGLRVNALALNFADASLDASGAFTFTADTLTGFPDVTRPIGSLDLLLTGGATLLQRLTTAGIVSSEQAMGAQMMMGIFGIPGDGDTLSSTIETDVDGGITVNGNKVR